MEAVITAPADRVRERFGRWATVTSTDSTRCRLRMQVDSLDWAVLVLGSMDAEFHVVRPAALVDQLADWADRFGRAVQAGGESAVPR